MTGGLGGRRRLGHHVKNGDMNNYGPRRRQVRIYYNICSTFNYTTRAYIVTRTHCHPPSTSHRHTHIYPRTDTHKHPKTDILYILYNECFCLRVIKNDVSFGGVVYRAN